MNFIDRTVSFFSPRAGLDRLMARKALEFAGMVPEGYGAGGRGRRNRSWTGKATSANVEIGQAMATLRNRAREFTRDSWAGARILDVFPAHVVGTGIKVSPNTGSDRDDRLFRSAFEAWEENADIEGVLNFGGLQSLAIRSMMEGGEAVLRMIDVPMDDSPGVVPMRMLGLEGDQIDTRRDRMPGGSDARLGIELGQWGRRKGIWMLAQHPGEATLVSTLTSSNLIDWNDLCHVYRPLRFGQVRGVTWFAPVLLTAKEIQDLIEAAIVQARTQASFAGFLKRPAGAANPLMSGKDENGDKVTRIEPGVVADIGDSDIVFAQPSSQSSFAEVHIAGLQALAAGAGLTYDQVTGDLRQANYSSLRAGKIEFFRLVDQTQWNLVVPRVVMPVVRRFRHRAVLGGFLPARKHEWPVDLIMPAREPIDPKKDLEADIAAVRSGRTTPQEFMSSWGFDWRKNIEDFKAFFAASDAANVTFDIDPRKPQNGASANGGPADQTPPG